MASFLCKGRGSTSQEHRCGDTARALSFYRRVRVGSYLIAFGTLYAEAHRRIGNPWHHTRRPLSTQMEHSGRGSYRRSPNSGCSSAASADRQPPLVCRKRDDVPISVACVFRAQVPILRPRRSAHARHFSTQQPKALVRSHGWGV